MSGLWVIPSYTYVGKGERGGGFWKGGRGLASDKVIMLWLGMRGVGGGKDPSSHTCVQCLEYGSHTLVKQRAKTSSFTPLDIRDPLQSHNSNNSRKLLERLHAISDAGS